MHQDIYPPSTTPPSDARATKSPADQPIDPSDDPKTERVFDELQLAISNLGMLLIGLLYLALPERIVFGPLWLPLVLEVVLVTPLLIALLRGRYLPYPIARTLALTLLAVVTTALGVSLALWIQGLPSFKSGPRLLETGALLWVINVLVFAVWYWEIDGGGPRKRLCAPYTASDLQFPQQQNGNPTRWAPRFIDYLFVAFCFSTALSPADTSPLTWRTKVLMMAQALISLTLIALVIGRSINILS
jgi:hypothetical protein